MSKTDPLGYWPELMELVRVRMEHGTRTYGAQSFRRHPVELVGEIEEELADVCGWGFILWARLQQLKSKLRQIQKGMI